MKAIFKEIAYNSPDWKKAVRLREEILRKPLGSASTQQELEEEKAHHQIAGFFAVNFCLKNDYSAQGDYFDEDGILHLKMSKELQ